MKIHYLQHVSFEGLSSIEPVLKAKGHQLSCTHLYNNQSLPPINDFDWLIIMGGPMGVYDEKKYPWLSKEKQFIKKAIDSKKIVLGICLGAQLIADVLGARIYKNKYREIGWFNIHCSPEACHTILAEAIPEHTMSFHWHADTFDIPKNATPIARSDACDNQGFVLNDRVAAFQFHLETTPASASALIENCRNELDDSRYVQTEQQILSNPERFSRMNQIMTAVLNALEKKKI